MKFPLRVLSLAMLLASGIQALHAQGGYKFDITADQKRLEAKAGAGGIGVKSKLEDWCYKVDVINKSFKSVTNVEIKYFTFMKPDAAGEITHAGAAILKRSKMGSVTIPAIKNLEKYEFNTDAMTLVMTQLKPGYVWKSGANQSSRDVLRGLWLKIYVDGQEVAEYFTPASLKDRESWDVK